MGMTATQYLSGLIRQQGSRYMTNWGHPGWISDDVLALLAWTVEANKRFRELAK